jgi:hypothetical protein
MPSRKRTLKPTVVSLKPSAEPLSSVKRVKRLLGRPTYPKVRVSLRARG